MSDTVTRRDRIRADRRLLATIFPLAFAQPGHGGEKIPLQIGIHQDLFAAGIVDNEGTPLSRRRVREAVADYCQGPKYLRALANSSYRIDLNGFPVDAVREEDANAAKKRLTSIRSAQKRNREQSKKLSVSDALLAAE